MPLSEEEQRLLEQMEEALAAEDPKLVLAMRGSSTRARHKRLAIAGALGFLVGVAVLMTGAVQKNTYIAVAGFLLMLGSAYLALNHGRRLKEPDLPDNVRPIGKSKSSSAAPRQSGFMNRMEDRWRRRRDDY